MSNQVELLSPPSNYAVVQLPERNYPGVVFQGDSLHILVQDLEEFLCLLKNGDLEDLAIGLEDMKETLNDVRAHYENVCKEKGLSLTMAMSESTTPRTWPRAPKPERRTATRTGNR